MLRAYSVSVLLLLCVLISSANSQVKEYDCPEDDLNLCTKPPIYEYQNVLECKSDYVCRLGQKCCNNCNYGYKVCTNIVIKEYLTNQDEYLKNKYCPKAKPCLTPLKYDRRYRCLSDEACSYGYKCCKSDCYIHKVCVVPVDKEGVAAVPPLTTTVLTTTEEKFIPTVLSTFTRLPKTTIFLPTTKEDEITSDEVTATKPPITTSIHQDTDTLPPIIISTRQTTTQETPTKTEETTDFVGSDEITTTDLNSSSYTKLPIVTKKEVGEEITTTKTSPTTLHQEVSTKILETIQTNFEITDDDFDFETTSVVTPSTSYTKITTTAKRETEDITSTTFREEISTKILETIQTSTKFPKFTDGITDDDKDGDDSEDNFGSGHGENIETKTTTTIFTSYTEFSTGTENEIGNNITTIRTFPTTVLQTISTRIPEIIQRPTEFTGSSDGATNDDEDGDDSEDNFGSGDDTNVETKTTTTVSTSYKEFTTDTEKDIVNNITTIKTLPTTVLQKISTKIPEVYQTPTEFFGSSDGTTDDDEDGDNEDDFGSGNGENVETNKTTTVSTSYTEFTTDTEKEIENNITTIRTLPTTVLQEISTKIPELYQTPTDFLGFSDGTTDDDEDGANVKTKTTTTVSTFYTEFTASTEKEIVDIFSTIKPFTTTVPQNSTKIPELYQTPTEFLGSSDGTTDDDEDGDDGDGFGSGDGANVETKTTTTISTSYVEFTTGTEKEVVNNITTIRLFPTTVPQKISTKIPETNKTSSEFFGSAGSFTSYTKFATATEKENNIISTISDGDTSKNVSGNYEETTTENEFHFGDGENITSTNQAAIAISTSSTNREPTDFTTSVTQEQIEKNVTEEIDYTTETRTSTRKPFESVDVVNSTIHYETLQPSSTVTTSNSVNTPSLVEFDYEDDNNTTAIPIVEESSLVINENGDQNLVSSSSSPSSVSEINSSKSLNGDSISSTTFPINNTTNRTNIGNILTTLTDNNVSTEDYIHKEYSNSNSETNKLNVDELKKIVDNVNSNGFSQHNFLSEGSGGIGDIIKEDGYDDDDDDDNGDDVDDDIRRNFNNALLKKAS